jgi:hypothetical protein
MADDTTDHTTEADPRQARLRVSIYESERHTRPTLLEGTRDDLSALLTAHKVGSKTGSAFSFAELKPGGTRGTGSVARVHGFAGDLDHGDKGKLLATVEAIKAANLWAAISSTHSHRPDRLKMRVAMLFSRPVSPSEYTRIWPVIDQRLALHADPATKDPAHLFFLPRHPAGAKPFVWSHDGDTLDVDELIRSAPPVSAEPKRARSGAEWAALLDNLGEGNRDHGLAQLAGVLFRGLPARLAFEILHSVNESRCKPPLSPEQVDKIADSIARREAQS